MQKIKTREEKFGTIIYDPSLDRFMLKPRLEQSKILNKKLSAPLTIHWILTMRCNARCSYCYELPFLLKPSDKEQVLSEENIKKFIDEFFRLGGFRLYITGGEPTLAPSLPYIIKTAYEKGIKTVINSNGVRIPEKVYSALKMYGGRISLSLDSHIKELHNRRRNQRSYDSIVEVMKKAKSDGVDVRVISVLQERDINYYKDFGRFLSSLGVCCWFLQEETENGGEKLVNRELEGKLKEEFPGMRVRVLPAIFDSFMYLLPNGDVGINLWNSNRKIYGNVLEKSLQEIWNHHKYNKVKSHLGILHIKK